MENNDLQVNVILVDLLMNLYHLSVILSFCPVASTKKTVLKISSLSSHFQRRWWPFSVPACQIYS